VLPWLLLSALERPEPVSVSPSSFLSGSTRMPILVSIGSVRPPQMSVVEITIASVVDTYNSLCSAGKFCA